MLLIKRLLSDFMLPPPIPLLSEHSFIQIPFEHLSADVQFKSWIHLDYLLPKLVGQGRASNSVSSKPLGIQSHSPSHSQYRSIHIHQSSHHNDGSRKLARNGANVSFTSLCCGSLSPFVRFGGRNWN